MKNEIRIALDLKAMSKIPACIEKVAEYVAHH